MVTSSIGLALRNFRDWVTRGGVVPFFGFGFDAGLGATSLVGVVHFTCTQSQELPHSYRALASRGCVSPHLYCVGVVGDPALLVQPQLLSSAGLPQFDPTLAG